jgi:hypothetical protein
MIRASSAGLGSESLVEFSKGKESDSLDRVAVHGLNVFEVINILGPDRERNRSKSDWKPSPRRFHNITGARIIW